MSEDRNNQNITRYGMVIDVLPEKVEEYKRLHAAAWPGVLKTIRECNIRNYSIYFKEVEPGRMLLFSYFEYIGSDYEGDMRKMAADPVTQEWWSVCVPCVRPVKNSAGGELWSVMEEVFHTD